jgi:hypothetical protein
MYVKESIYPVVVVNKTFKIPIVNPYYILYNHITQQDTKKKAPWWWRTYVETCRSCRMLINYQNSAFVGLLRIKMKMHVLIVSIPLCLWYDMHKYYTIAQQNSLLITFFRNVTCFGVSQTAIIRPSNRQWV